MAHPRVPVGCAEAAPPPVACEEGRCALSYPPLEAACQSDSDCVAVPKLLASAPAGGCRIACGQFVAGARTWGAWANALWQNTSVTGACAPGCDGRPLAAATCVAHACVLREPRGAKITRIDLRAATVTGPLSREAVEGVVRAGTSKLAACEERPRSMAPLGYAGFRMAFTIGADGRIDDLDVGEIAQYVPEIGACMARAMRELSFPRPAGGARVRVEYPMGAAFAP